MREKNSVEKETEHNKKICYTPTLGDKCHPTFFMCAIKLFYLMGLMDR